MFVFKGLDKFIRFKKQWVKHYIPGFSRHLKTLQSHNCHNMTQAGQSEFRAFNDGGPPGPNKSPAMSQIAGDWRPKTESNWSQT